MKNVSIPNRTLFGSLVALVVGATLGVSVNHADANIGTPGWNYGGINCGCYNYNCDTFVCCLACCLGAPAADRNDCRKFCDQAVFPCLPPCDPDDLEPCD